MYDIKSYVNATIPREMRKSINMHMHNRVPKSLGFLREIFTITFPRYILGSHVEDGDDATNRANDFNK